MPSKILGLALIVPLLGCAAPPETGKLPVVELPGRTRTVSELESYLDANLMSAPDAEDDRPSAQDLSEVKSRLFDNFVDEEVLLFEAERQGVEVGDGEVDAYLSNADGGTGAAASLATRREAARRDLAIQKLRESLVRKRASVTPDEVDAYVLQHRADLPRERRLVLRSLLLSSEEQANKVYADVRSHRQSFDQAVAASGAGSGQGEPLEVELDSLPESVQIAVGDLQSGEVSRPVLVQGSTYLFFVEAWASSVDDEEAIRRRARDELLRQKYERASRQLLEELRSKVRPKIEIANLPFRYVPEGASRGAENSSELR